MHFEFTCRTMTRSTHLTHFPLYTLTLILINRHSFLLVVLYNFYLLKNNPSDFFLNIFQNKLSFILGDTQIHFKRKQVGEKNYSLSLSSILSNVIILRSTTKSRP